MTDKPKLPSSDITRKKDADSKQHPASQKTDTTNHTSDQPTVRRGRKLDTPTTPNDTAVDKLAARLHERWQTERNYLPRMKPTTDQAWIARQPQLLHYPEVANNKRIDIIGNTKTVKEPHTSTLSENINPSSSQDLPYKPLHNPEKPASTPSDHNPINLKNSMVWINAQGDRAKLDIAATTYQGLPANWQAENKASAEGAISIIRNLQSSGTDMTHPENIELASALLHENWLSRNNSWASPEQRLPYAQLSEIEKEKDRVVIREALDILNKSS